MIEHGWSGRARRLLARGARRPSETQVQLRDWLARLGVPFTAPLVAFWDRIDGLTYEVRGTSGATRFALVPDMTTDAAGRPYIACGEHDGAPFAFYLGLDGRLVVADDSTHPIVVASSAALYIESDAVLDELMDLQPEWRWILLGEVAKDDRRVSERVGLPLIAEASDAYIRWWGDDQVRVSRHVFWDDTPPRDRIVGYARTDQEARRLVTALGDVTGKGCIPIYTWPPTPVRA